MILIREDDTGTKVHEPRLHNIRGGPSMTVATYLNGRWCDTFDYPVPSWPKLRRSYLDTGFRESTEKAELRATIDPMYGVAAVTSLFRADLDKPGTGDPDYPVEPYVDQADTVFYKAGYTRLNNWWTSDDGLTTIVVKSVDTIIPPGVPFGMSVALQTATTAIRNQLGIDSPDASPDVAADHLRLLEDPTWKGFGGGLVEIAQHDYPKNVKSAVAALMRGLEYAARGDAAAVDTCTGRAVQLAGGGR